MKLTFYKEIMQFVMICNNIFQKYGSPIEIFCCFAKQKRGTNSIFIPRFLCKK